MATSCVKELAAALDEVDHLLASKRSAWTSQRAKVAPTGEPPPSAVKTWRSKSSPGRTVQGTAEQLKASKNPGDWEEVTGG